MIFKSRVMWSYGVVIAALALLGGGCPVVTNPGSPPDTVPAFDAAKFTNPTQIDNQYNPLVPGTTRTYTSDAPDGVERIVVEVLAETRVVNGVACRVVRDRVYLDDVLVEDTRDFFAQDADGNVWYLGEDVDNYNYDGAGVIVDITHEGSWEAGKDVAGLGVVALPGFQMPAAPTPGTRYHQEFYEGEAEDMAEIVATGVAVRLSGGSEHTCVQTRDFSSIEPALNEYKYYAPGIGLVLEEPVGGGPRVELERVPP